MTPAEAALVVAKELDAMQAWNYDTIECKSLEKAAEAFRLFAQLLSTPVSDGGPGEG